MFRPSDMTKIIWPISNRSISFRLYDMFLWVVVYVKSYCADDMDLSKNNNRI